MGPSTHSLTHWLRPAVPQGSQQGAGLARALPSQSLWSSGSFPGDWIPGFIPFLAGVIGTSYLTSLDLSFPMLMPIH